MSGSLNFAHSKEKQSKEKLRQASTADKKTIGDIHQVFKDEFYL